MMLYNLLRLCRTGGGGDVAGPRVEVVANHMVLAHLYLWTIIRIIATVCLTLFSDREADRRDNMHMIAEPSINQNRKTKRGTRYRYFTNLVRDINITSIDEKKMKT